MVLAVLVKQMSRDNSVLVRSIIARGVLPRIIEEHNLDSGVIEQINNDVKAAKLDPWFRKDVLQVLDVGCQFGEATAGMAKYYRDEGFVEVEVVGVDCDYLPLPDECRAE